MCGHTFLYSPPVRRIKEILDAGELGDLHFISSRRTNLGPYRSDVSVLFDLGAARLLDAPLLARRDARVRSAPSAAT